MQDQPQYPYPQYPPNQPQYPPPPYPPQPEYPPQPQYPPQHVQPQNPSQAKKIPTWAWISGVGVLVAVLLCCSCGFLAMAMGGTSTTSQSNSQKSAVNAPTAAPTTTPQASAPAYSYLASDNTGVIFLQWSDTGNGQVEGTANLAYVQQGTVETGQASVSGTHAGSVLTLTLRGPNGDLSCHGKFQGTSLRISYTDSNGYVSTFNMRPATEADYNVALQQFYARNGQ